MTSGPRDGRTGQSRSVAFVYGGIAGALLMAVAVVALVVVPPSPPSIAEFAPSAAETIDEAPDQQSSQFGDGGSADCGAGQSGCVTGDPTLTTTTTSPREGGDGRAKEVVKARVRRCVGDPPRQTEDPQSPPCVNYFDGDNGGATHRGVTRDEIRIGLNAFYRNSGSGPVYTAIVDHFNRRYELYGRQFRPFYGPSDFGDDQAAVQRRLADRFVESGVFAGVASPASDSRSYNDSLTGRGVISIDDGGGLLTDASMRAVAPFLWSYGPTIDRQLAATASWVCSSLAGRPARMAGPPLTVQTRRFAVLRGLTVRERPDVGPLVRALGRCGIDDVRTFDLPERQGVAENDPAYRTAMAALQADNRTSLLCVCSRGDFDPMLPAAAAIRYEPEFIVTGSASTGADTTGGQQNPGSLRLFGVTPAPKPLDPANEPWYQAVREVAPDLAIPLDHQVDSFAAVYRAMLVLASGVQGAGPTLTPQTFQAGLLGTTFSNPGAAKAPFFQASISLTSADRSMVDDFAVVYKDANANRGARNPAGYCYVRRGARWATTFPDLESELFDPTKPCR